MDAGSLLESFGYLVIFVSIFIECGVLLGLILPFPSFTLLFAAGVFATTGKLELLAIIVIATIAAVAGYIVGYFTGLKYGRKLLYEKATKKYFTRQQGESAEKFMKRHGYSTLVLGRWIPILRCLAPILSGVAKTPFKAFMVANILGGLLWVVSSTYAGYYIGQIVPNAQYYILPFVFLTVVIINSPYGKRIMERLVKKVEEY